MPMQPKIKTYTYRAVVTFELTIDAADEDEALEAMEASHWFKAWVEQDGAEIWLHDVTDAGADHVDD